MEAAKGELNSTTYGVLQKSSANITGVVLQKICAHFPIADTKGFYAGRALALAKLFSHAAARKE